MRSSQALELVKLRISPIKDLWLFIIGILLISMTSAAIGSFVSGIKPSEFFLGDVEDVLVITQPGTSTPMTGNVPESLTDDLKKLTGVENVSAEILGVIVAQNLNDGTIVIRGITAAFFNITHPVTLQGNWFDELSKGITNSSASFGVVAGTLLVKNRGLSIGSKLILVSTLAAMTIEVTIEGILTTDTPIDSELILPLPTVRSMTGRSTGQVTFIRVKVDPEKLPISELTQILNSEYAVQVLVRSRDTVENNDLEEEPVLVYDPDRNSDNIAELKLRGAGLHSNYSLEPIE